MPSECTTKRIPLSACAALRVVTVPRDCATFGTAWEMMDEIVRRIGVHGGVAGHCVVDRFAHAYLQGGPLGAGIRDAREILLRFDLGIPRFDQLAAAPQAIGIVELADRFVISRTEAPDAASNAAMSAWVRGLVHAPAAETEREEAGAAAPS